MHYIRQAKQCNGLKFLFSNRTNRKTADSDISFHRFPVKDSVRCAKDTYFGCLWYKMKLFYRPSEIWNRPLVGGIAQVEDHWSKQMLVTTVCSLSWINSKGNSTLQAKEEKEVMQDCKWEIIVESQRNKTTITILLCDNQLWWCKIKLITQQPCIVCSICEWKLSFVMHTQFYRCAMQCMK